MIFDRRLSALSAWLLLVSGAFALELPVKFRAEASGAWVENLSRTSAEPFRKDAARYHGTFVASTLREWRTGFMTSAELSAELQHTPDFNRTDAFSVGPRIGVRRKFGLGAFAPVIDGSAGLVHRDARIAGDDGWLATASVRVSKRLTRSWRVAVTGDWHQHYARSATFDTFDRRVHAAVTWDVTPRWQVTYGAGRLWGDFAANAAPSVWPLALSGALGPAVFDYYNTVPWSVTDAFGPGWVTYRVSGQANFHWLEIAPAIGRNTSLPLRYERILTENKIGIKYPQETWTLSILHRF